MHSRIAFIPVALVAFLAAATTAGVMSTTDGVPKDPRTLAESAVSPDPVRIYAQRACDYECLNNCQDGCREDDLDSREYNLCMDQCRGRCDCN